MDRDSMKSLELDVRMLRRRGWINKEDLEVRLSALPDVSEKVVPAESEAEPHSSED